MSSFLERKREASIASGKKRAVGTGTVPIAQRTSEGVSFLERKRNASNVSAAPPTAPWPVMQQAPALSTTRQTRPKSAFSPAAVLSYGASPAAGRELLGYTKPVTLTKMPSAAVGTEKKAGSQAAPYAAGGDTFTPASSYAAGLQAKQAWETPKSEQPDTALPSFPQRVMDTVSGGLKGTGASMTNMLGTLREMGQESRDKENQAMIDDYARELEEAQARLDAALEDVVKDPKAWTQGDIQSFYNARDDAQRKYDAVAKVYGKENQEKTIQGTYEAADKLQLSSAQDIERAKEGLGVPGQMLVDAGASVTQMAGDAVGGALLGNGMIPFVMRAFGGGTQQARQDGADLRGQVGYGAAIAAKEYVTEKMFGIALPFSRIYGGGAVDDAVERVIQTAVEKLASTPQGQKAVGGLLTMLASGVTEGLEEFIGDWLEWQMPRIYGGNVDTAAETLISSLYDFAVGGITGLAGGAFSLGQYTPQGMDDESIRPAGMDENTWAALQRTAEEMYGAGESTQINADPLIHTPEQQAIIEAYQANTDSALKSFFEAYLEDPQQGFSRYNISPVTQRQAEDIKRLLGGEYEGYTNAINSNGAIHILNEHGPEGTVDHSLEDLNDISRLGYVLEQYDDVEIVTYKSGEADLSKEFRTKDDRPAPMLKFRKRVDGTYYVIEAVPESKHKKLWVVSAYMEKADGGTQAPDAGGPRNTPDASLASSPSASDPIIPSSGDGVNMEYAQPGGEDILPQTAPGPSAEERLQQLIQQKAIRRTMLNVDEETEARLTQTAREMYGAGESMDISGVETGVQAQKTAPVEGAEVGYPVGQDEAEVSTKKVEEVQKFETL